MILLFNEMTSNRLSPECDQDEEMLNGPNRQEARISVCFAHCSGLSLARANNAIELKLKILSAAESASSFSHCSVPARVSTERSIHTNTADTAERVG